MGDKILVLLIGTNPLPNYIVGSYLKEKYNKFILIYSKENNEINQDSTGDYAEKLKEHLNLNSDYIPLPLSDISNPKSIKNDLEEKFPKENIDEVHLNYTGGTKAMVAHVYNFLKEKFGDKFSASYLDARTNYIVYDNDNKEKITKEYLDINILVDIHLYEKAGNELLYTFDNYKYRCNKSSDDKKIFDEIANVIKNEIERNSDKEEVLSTLKKYSNTTDYINNLYDDFIKDRLKDYDRKKVIYVLQRIENQSQPFLSGGFWLEWYVYLKLKEKIEEKKDKNLKEGKHFGINLKVKKSGGSNNFELDIFIINDNKLTGISITKSKDQGECKLKGFEVIHRVKQIGGDESKAILITGLKKEYENDSNKGTKKLQEDLSFITGTAKDKITVFGIDDWEDIGDKICKEVFQ